MQNPLEPQDTIDTSGARNATWIDHVLPFQRSAESPTAAVHEVGEPHETLDPTEAGPSPALCSCMTDHVTPFQRSASDGGAVSGGIGNAVFPTATQNFADGHDTLAPDILPNPIGDDNRATFTHGHFFAWKGSPNTNPAYGSLLDGAAASIAARLDAFEQAS